MKMIARTKLVAVMMAGLFVTSASSPVWAQAQQDIVDTAVSAGTFKTLATALNAAGLVGVLKGPGPFTVFAPTDDAFAKLPAGTVESLLKDPERLKSILLYHVVGGKVSSKEVAGLPSAKSVQGTAIPITVSGNRVMADKANVTKADIMATNGIIHVIDTVMIPK